MRKTFRYCSTSIAAIVMLCSLLSAAASVAAAEPEPNTLGASAIVVDDARLGELRGRYVPPATKPSTKARDLTTSTTLPPSGAVALAKERNDGASLRMLDVGSGTHMTRFDVVLASQWTTGAGADARTTSAGVAIGYDLTTGTLDTPTSYAVVSGGSGGTASAPSPDKSVTGSLPPINGVAQSIAVAGNGNSASNHATIDVGPGGTTGVVVPSGTACATCTVTIGGGGIGVQIAMPQGLASQTIDANGLAQSIRVASDFNAILNTLQLHVQTGNIGTAAFPPFALPPTFLTLGMH